MIRLSAHILKCRLIDCAPRAFLWAVLLGLIGASPLAAAQPVLKELAPPGAQRGKTFTLALKGERLVAGAELITTLPATLSRLAPRKDLETPDSELLFLVQLPPDAPVGLYPARVRTEEGLSNVLIFSVGDLPEILEKEPNNSMAEAQPIDVPTTVNGHLTAADQDFYRFSVKAHERLVLEVEARRLASAIDPAIEVLDSSGRRVAFDDDAPGLGVDARVEVTFPKTGNYFVVVHDSKYSEQEITFYRLKVGSYSYAEGIFPLGWQRGKSVEVTFFGGNLEKPVIVRTTLDAPEGTRFTSINLPGPRPVGSLPFPFRVGDFPEALAPANGSVADLQPSTVMNGRIQKPGQIDRYKLKVSPGQKWLFRLEAASLVTSRLYGELSVHDSLGKSLKTEDVGEGADPQLAFTVPDKVQEVTLAVQDLRNLGGPAFGYRLLALPQSSDFSLRLLTPYVNVPITGTTMIGVLAQRYGYDGPIRLSIPKLPEDFLVEGGDIPAAGLNYAGGHQRESRGQLTLTAKANAKPGAFLLSVWGEGGPQDHPIRRRAEGPGIVFFPNEEPLYDAQNNLVPAKSVTAPWLGMELPAAITKSLPATLQVANPSFRLVVGMSHAIDWKLLSQGPGVVPDMVKATLQYGEIKGLELRGINESKGKNAGSLVLLSQPDSPLVNFNMVLQETLEINGKQETITAPAVTVELVRGYSIALASNRVEMKRGGKMELAGTVERDPTFAAAVKIKVFDPPDKVSCPAIEVPVEKSDFHLVCEVSPDTQGGDFEVHLVSSATIPGRKDNREYSYPPLTAHMIVVEEKASQTVASKQ